MAVGCRLPHILIFLGFIIVVPKIKSFIGHDVIDVLLDTMTIST
jgi:hypothetical protein